MIALSFQQSRHFEAAEGGSGMIGEQEVRAYKRDGVIVVPDVLEQ